MDPQVESADVVSLMDLLPHELVLKIFSHLTTEQLLNSASLVCKYRRSKKKKTR